MERKETLLKTDIHLIYFHWAEGKEYEPWRFGTGNKEKLYPCSPWLYFSSLLPGLSHYLDKYTWPHLLTLLNIFAWVKGAEASWRRSIHCALSITRSTASGALTIPVHCWRDETITPAAPSGAPVVRSSPKPTMQYLWWVRFEQKLLSYDNLLKDSDKGLCVELPEVKDPIPVLLCGWIPWVT